MQRFTTAALEAAVFVTRFEFAILLLASPLFLFPSITRVWFFALLPFLWLAAALAGREPVPPTPLNAGVALMAVMVLVSVWATYDITFSLSKIAGVVFGLGLFFAVVRTMRTVESLDLALHFFITAGVALAGVGILGTNWINKVPAFVPIIQRLPAVIRGVPGQAEGFQPNAIAGALIMFIPLQFAMARGASSRKARLAHGGALLFTLATLLLTQSRGAWLAFGVAIVLWCLWHSPRSRVLGSVMIAGGILALAIGREKLLATASREVGSGLASNVEGRLELWSRAITAIGDFPITGMGMNTFRRVMPVLYPTFLSPPSMDIAHAHNHLLQAALDIGLPGLIAYLSLYLGSGALLVRAYRSSDDRPMKWRTGALAAGLIAYFLFQTTDTIALGAKVGVFFWVDLALVAALHDRVFRVREEAACSNGGLCDGVNSGSYNREFTGPE